MAFPSNATVSTLPSLTWTIGSQDFEITPDKYLIPQGLYSSLNLTEGGVQYSWIISAGFGSYMFGQKWLESFYTAYDMQNHRKSRSSLFHLDILFRWTCSRLSLTFAEVGVARLA